MPEDQVAALVVLRPGAGDGPGAQEPITAATLERHAPDPETAERVRRFFAEQGFEVGPLVGTSFSIAGPRSVMLRLSKAFDELEGSGRELPLEGLPPDVRQAIQAVTTEGPPDYGPGNP